MDELYRLMIDTKKGRVQLFSYLAYCHRSDRQKELDKWAERYGIVICGLDNDNRGWFGIEADKFKIGELLERPEKLLSAFSRHNIAPQMLKRWTKSGPVSGRFYRIPLPMKRLPFDTPAHDKRVLNTDYKRVKRTGRKPKTTDWGIELSNLVKRFLR